MADAWVMAAYQGIEDAAYRQRESDVWELGLRVAIELENETLFGPMLGHFLDR